MIGFRLPFLPSTCWRFSLSCLAHKEKNMTLGCVVWLLATGLSLLFGRRYTHQFTRSQDWCSWLLACSFPLSSIRRPKQWYLTGRLQNNFLTRYELLICPPKKRRLIDLCVLFNRVKIDFVFRVMWPAGNAPNLPGSRIVTRSFPTYTYLGITIDTYALHSTQDWRVYNIFNLCMTCSDQEGMLTN
jgi:hypothetical protein